jgi:UDP-N-acetylmuramoyl-tripeptide--D-alanyl-D-alanine ligase
MYTIREIAEVMGGIIRNADPDVEVTEFYIDSRNVKPNSIFFCIKGEKFDGKDFAEDAVKNGAQAVVAPIGSAISRTLPRILVDDVVLAMARLAADRMKKLKAKVIGITGSVGKTTTKELMYTFLSTRYRVFKSRKSHNNHIGLPLTVLEAPTHTDFLILEYGTNHPGEISYLTSIVKPHMAIVTRIGTAHIEFFETMENIAREKGTLYKELQPGGTAFLNAETPLIEVISSMVPYTAKRITFGIESGDVKPEDVDYLEFGTTFSYKGHTFYLPLPGKGMLENAMAALAVAETLETSLADITNILKDFKDEKMRLERKEIKGVVFINDAYNSNPDSLTELFRIFKGEEHRRIFILGDMLELGAYAEAEHRRMGRLFVEEGHKILVTVGKLAKLISEEASRNGITEVHHFESKEEVVDFLKNYVKPGDRVILKASRALALETILNKLEEIL